MLKTYTLNSIKLKIHLDITTKDFELSHPVCRGALINCLP